MKDSAKIKEQLREILARYKGERVELILILEEVQERLGYLPKEALLEIADFVHMPAASIYGVATFYNRFRFTPSGRHPIRVCMGTACHLQGGALVMEALERELEIKVGGVTPDEEFSLDRIACVGCCVLAPVIVIDREVSPKMTPFKVEEVLAGLQEPKDATGPNA
jgi:NADH-quinone oxidoreductase subunit E